MEPRSPHRRIGTAVQISCVTIGDLPRRRWIPGAHRGHRPAIPSPSAHKFRSGRIEPTRVPIASVMQDVGGIIALAETLGFDAQLRCGSATIAQLVARSGPVIGGLKAQSVKNVPPFVPYIASDTSIRELTPFPLIVGTLLGIIFGASSLYLVLKVGLTVSASIPVAVISITLFRILSKLGARDATILEHNIVQTTGSAGESIAFGIGVTMPAILILGFDLDIWRVTLVAVLGGLLGILMMIPLRRALIKDQHGFLKYPEGTACAQVLIAGASKESREASHEGDTAVDDTSALQGGKIITVGFIIGFIYKSLVDVFS